jgi:hypothetical protein
MLATVVEKAVQKEANAGNDLGESLFTAKPTPFFVEKTSSQLPPTLVCPFPRSAPVYLSPFPGCVSCHAWSAVEVTDCRAQHERKIVESLMV